MTQLIARETSVEELHELRSHQGPERFIESLGRNGLLIRLDERGSAGEPTPWAFREGMTPMGVRLRPKNLPSTPWDEVPEFPEPNDDPDKTEEITDELGLGFPIPPSRGAATVYVLPMSVGTVNLTVGRQLDCDISIQERSISRHHAEIQLQDNQPGLLTKDLSSSNGVKVRGRLVQGTGAMKVRFGDTLAFGDVVFLFLSAEQFNKNLKYFMD